jgi:ribosomal protein S28E/S33
MGFNSGFKELRKIFGPGYPRYVLNTLVNKIKINYVHIQKAMVRPVVTYSSETWTLTANNLRIFERQILRKIFGPVNIDSVLKIRMVSS